MSWVEIKKAVNSDLDIPLDQQIGLIPFDEYFCVKQNIALAEGTAEQTIYEYTGKCIVLFVGGYINLQSNDSYVHFYKDGTEIQKFRVVPQNYNYNNFGYIEKNSIVGVTLNSGNAMRVMSLYNNSSMTGNAVFPFAVSGDVMFRPLDAPNDISTGLTNVLVVGHNFKCDSSFKITIERKRAYDNTQSMTFGMVLGVYN